MTLLRSITMILAIAILSSCGHGKLEGEGPENREKIRSAIREVTPEIQKCYADELEKNPKLKGKVIVAFVVVEGGLVTEEKIKSSTLKNETVHKCMLAVLKKQKFPEPAEKTTAVIDFPFIFGSGLNKDTENN